MAHLTTEWGFFPSWSRFIQSYWHVGIPWEGEISQVNISFLIFEPESSFLWFTKGEIQPLLPWALKLPFWCANRSAREHHLKTQPPWNASFCSWSLHNPYFFGTFILVLIWRTEVSNVKILHTSVHEILLTRPLVKGLRLVFLYLLMVEWELLKCIHEIPH